ncbi:MAG: hypothetical protein HY558_05155 [Euryarchaeota archaeon]|nr:hypothetical protein [Euryarchaeota archaeon]
MRPQNLRRCDAGQLHTLEGLSASLLMVLVLLYAVQATSITPLTTSTSNLHVESQLKFLAEDILTTSDITSGSSPSVLKSTIYAWNGSTFIWNGTAYTDEQNNNSRFNTTLTNTLRSVLVPLGIAHNVEFIFLDNSSSTFALTSKKVVWSGNPSFNAVTASRRVTLHLSEFNNSYYYANTSIGDLDNNTSAFQPLLGIYSPYNNTDLYNLVEVRLTLWRL